ncbi:anthranilate phosphoribosyltransferase [Rariglobus hedericola]|uniref:Anthranilate phosphoribosyltransferase n=1 Tax=Rariglobus hedericola TaxID=2597822 RepID=A0A556QNK4_9BACT|nr:anthranilate phosphoribosyltransferase [Rariglobus hedericola]TSJ78209.1 anthranilate phosphoribosyltransferase [Rariglobus hedericola]
MSALVELTRQLAEGQDLTEAQIAPAADALTSPEIADPQKAAFLSAFSDKGETAGEIAAFARVFRERAVDPGVGQWSADAIDVVGTGGDRTDGFNISSLVTLTLASAGVKVMKHGNRGFTSKCGSADLLAALGFDLEARPEKIRGALDQLGYAFFFAPAYHPSFKHIGPVRKQLAAQGRRTIFNIFGPLLNPGRPAFMLFGVFPEPMVEKLADVFQLLGTSAGLAGHGILNDGRGIDEITTATVNHVRGFGRLRSTAGEWRAADFGLKQSAFSDLQGGDLAMNMGIVDALIEGRAPQGLVDTISLNAALGLWITGRTGSVAEGVEQARELLVGGAVKAKIAATREFFQK